MLQISIEQLEGAIKNAKACIAFENNDFQKQYFRGALDTLTNLLAKATLSNLSDKVKANKIIEKFDK